MRYHYLHIWSVLDFDYGMTEYLGDQAHPPQIGKVGLELDFWPADSLFQVWPLFFCTQELKDELQAGFDELTFKPVNNIKKGQNLEALYPDIDLPKQYWRMNITGVPGENHFGLWEQLHLVVSDKALARLREHGVRNAESNLIDENLAGYFSSGRSNFWML